MAETHFQEKGTFFGAHDQIHTLGTDHVEGLNSSNKPLFGQENKRSSAPRYWMHWWVEVASLLASVGLFIAIVIILRIYDGKLQPQWQYDFNLNALIAILSTFLRITMMDVVTTLMGQLKWNWFTKPRKLSQLESIDNGSRAPWSAFMLVFELRRPHPLLLGGAITVLSLAVGFFTQQAVTSIPCVIHITNTTASVLIRRSVPSVETSRLGAGLFEVDWAVKSSLQAAFAGRIPAAPVVCPTGNCAFPTVGGISYSSIGLCTKCVDTSSRITQNRTLKSSGRSEFILPNNGSILISASSNDAYINVKFGHDGFSSSGAKAPPWMVELDPTLASFNTSFIGFVNVLSFTAAGCEIKGFDNTISSKVECVSDRPDLPDIGGDHKVVGTGCVLYGCVNNYDARFANGQLVEKVVSTVPATGADKSQEPIVGITLPCYVEGKPYDLSNMSLLDPGIPRYITKRDSPANNTIPLDCVYEMEWEYITGTVKYLKTLFQGNGTYITSQGTINGMPIASFSENWWLASLYNRGLADFDSISNVFENVTEAFTNYLRLPHPEYEEKYTAHGGKGKYWKPTAVNGTV